MSRSLGGAFIFGGCPRVEAAWRELLAGMDTSFSTRLELVGGSDRSSSIVSSSWSEELATVVRVRFCEWRTSDVSDLSEAVCDFAAGVDAAIELRVERRGAIVRQALTEEQEQTG